MSGSVTIHEMAPLRYAKYGYSSTDSSRICLTAISIALLLLTTPLGAETISGTIVAAGKGDLAISMQPATGIDLEDQRRANSAFSMLKVANAADKENFKMFCAYCHQIGTLGFEIVDPLLLLSIAPARNGQQE